MPDTASAARAAHALAARFGATPITRSQAHSIVSPRALRTAVARGAVQRLHHGTYVVVPDASSDLDRYRHRIAAALLARTGAVASHESALALHGLSLPRFGDSWDRHPARLIVARGERVRTSGLRVSRRALPDSHRTTTEWGLATSPARTGVDLARELPFPVALVVADEACALTLLNSAHPTLSPTTLRAGASRFRSALADQAVAARTLLLRTEAEAPWQPGCSRVRRVAHWVDPAAESPGESVSRAHLVAAGLPRPRVGLPVSGDDGRHYFADLAWPQFGVLGEVDGYGKYRSDAWDTFRREKRREDSLRAAGWTVVRWTVSDILHDPHSVVARVSRAVRDTEAPGKESGPGRNGSLSRHDD